jgi:hypothetical protein
MLTVVRDCGGFLVNTRYNLEGEIIYDVSITVICLCLLVLSSECQRAIADIVLCFHVTIRSFFF